MLPPQMERSPVLHVGFQALDALHYHILYPNLIPCSTHRTYSSHAWSCPLQMERSPVLHVGFQALDAFQASKGRLPEPASEDDAAEVIRLARGINEAARDKVGGGVRSSGYSFFRSCCSSAQGINAGDQ